MNERPKPSLRERVMGAVVPIVFTGGMIGGGASVVDSVINQSKIKETENAIAFLTPESSEQRANAYKDIEIYNENINRDLIYMQISGWVAVAGAFLIARNRVRREKIQSLQSPTS